MEDDVADGKRGGIEGVPVAVDNAVPVVGAHEVADVHIGDGIAIDLIAVVDGIAEGDEGGKEAVDGPETTHPVREAGGLRRVVGHAGRFSCVALSPSSQMEVARL